MDPFWATYLRAHARPGNRALHAVGSLAALALVALAAVQWAWWPLVAAPIVGYGAAWAGHFLVEKNRPATFGHPVRSFLADWRMLGLVLTGRAQAAVARAERSAPSAARQGADARVDGQRPA